MTDSTAQARRAIRRWHEGWLTGSDVGGPASFIMDDQTGHIIILAERATLAQDAPALLIPEESEPEVELLLNLQGRLPSEAMRDRWRAYHGPERSGDWAAAEAESVRLCISPGPDVLDGPDVLGPNPLRHDVNALLREPNSRRDDLARAVRRRIGEASVEPVAVGVDPWGLDVRARFGVIRLEFDVEALGPSAAAAAIGRLLDPDGA